jgi:hypothetical protein
VIGKPQEKELVEMSFRMPGLVTVVSLGLVALQAQSAAAQQPNVDFTVSGNSTIRSWACTAKGTLTVTNGTGAPAAPGFPSGVQSATLRVPVKSFTCPEEEMTEHLFEAMKPDEFPEIVYELEKYEVTGQRVQATGALRIGDVTAPAEIPLTLTQAADGVHVEGETRLDMTKFGIDPPVVMLGLLRVRPQISIQFTGVAAP